MDECEFPACLPAKGACQRNCEVRDLAHSAAPSGEVPFGVHSGQAPASAPLGGGHDQLREYERIDGTLGVRIEVRRGYADLLTTMNGYQWSGSNINRRLLLLIRDAVNFSLGAEPSASGAFPSSHPTVSPDRQEARMDEQTTYGCHCDLDPGDKPDSCVFDGGHIPDCRIAVRLAAEGNGKLDCSEWKPIALPPTRTEVESLRSALQRIVEEDPKGYFGLIASKALKEVSK